MKVNIGDLMSKERDMLELAEKEKIVERQDMAYLSMLMRLRGKSVHNGMRSIGVGHLPLYARSFVKHGIIIHSYSFASSWDGGPLVARYIATSVNAVARKIEGLKQQFLGIGMPLFVEQIPDTNSTIKKKIASWREHNSMRPSIGRWDAPPDYMISDMIDYRRDSMAYVSAFFFVAPMIKCEVRNDRIYWEPRQ